MVKMTISRTLTKAEKISVKKKYNYICEFCKCENILIMTVDHLVPLDRGGTDDIDNLVCACFVCNQLKGNMLPAEFKGYLKALKTLKSLGMFDLNICQIVPKFNILKRMDKK